MDDETLHSYVQTCRTRKRGWDGQIDRFVTMTYGKTFRIDRASSGWVCAQRRTGRALGWLQAKYRDQNSTDIPDLLVIVDDDTSVVRQYY